MGSRNIEFGADSLNGLVIKIDNYGNLLNEKEIVKYDSSFALYYGVQKGNGHYLLIGTLSDSFSPKDKNVTYVCELTPEFEVIWEKYHPLPSPYNNHLLINFLLDSDSILYIQGRADTSIYGSNDLLLTMKFDLEGNQLDLNFYPGWKDYGSYSDMIFNEDSTEIYLIGIYVRPISFLTEFIKMDLNMDINNYISVIDEDHYISTPITVKILPNGNIIQGNRATMETGTNQDLYVRIMDQELNTIQDTLIFYPEYVYPPTFNGLGFSDPNKIWVATFEGVPPVFSGSEVFRFHIFDSTLNLIGLKEYGGETRYWFYNLLMCSDGGCLLTGSVPDYDGSQNANGYIIKVMPEDIITHAEDTPFRNDKDVLVFPNPFSDKIQIQTLRQGLTFILFDLTGNVIRTIDINNVPNFKIETGNLQSGFYIYSIKYGKLIIQNGKLIKE
ncbi:MAG: T9SS type A sorting domain-containing protein [Bacteroidales bacterium]